MPEPEFELVVRGSHVFYFDFDALLFVVQGSEDGHLLFETPRSPPSTAIYH
jgi:hypothetical protein